MKGPQLTLIAYAAVATCPIQTNAVQVLQKEHVMDLRIDVRFT
jgi:hypothetical protein